jgi:uncharacterized membrane protein
MANIVLLFFLFIVYSFLGWIIECIYNYYDTGKLANRGFLIGPWIPIYGIGSLLIIVFLTKYMQHPITLFVMACVICSILEYFTSFFMEIIFKNRWWDYSHKKFNLNGRICLETTIPFGFAGLGLCYIGQPVLLFLIHKIPFIIIAIISIILAIIFLIDLCISFDIILNLKNISKNMRVDSTEQITKKVKEVLSKRGIFSRRLIQAFPKMKIKLPNIRKKKKK